MVKFKKSKYILSTDILDEYGFANKRILFSTRTATSIMIDEASYNSLDSENFEDLDFKLHSVLLEKEFIVPELQDEFAYVMESNFQVKENGDTLSLTIQPSANCQLGCHYCGQSHTKHYASDAIIDKYIERILYLMTLKNYNGLAITWYGGEPLTGYSAIKKASALLINLCKEKGIRYSSDMITNGLSLKPNLFVELATTCKVTQFQITIDGDAESHDKRRITKSGEPTFDIITNNIMNVVKTDEYEQYNCGISIRINIDSTNYKNVNPLLDFIKNKNLQDKVTVYFAPIVDFGGNDASKDSLNSNDFAKLEIDWLLICNDYGIQVSSLPKRKYAVCMAEKQDSEVFDAYGNIYACWEFPYSVAYTEGDSLIGNLNFPKETYNPNATLRNWVDTVKSGTTWCKTCNHLPICGGGCPKSWHEGTPACPPFKYNYKERLLLDYYIKKTN